MAERIIGLKKAAPYLRMYKGKVFVVKAGGEVLSEAKTLEHFAEQVALLHGLGISPVVVHGGGPQATALSERLGIPVEMVGGRRITDAQTLDVAKMVFNGKLNTDLLAAFAKHGVPAIGLSGVDASLIRATQRPAVPVADEKTGQVRDVDFGFVGDVAAVNAGVVCHLLAGPFVPVISAMAGGDDGQVYNVNADVVAARLAAALRAEKMILLTDVAGVLRERERPETLISHMDRSGLTEALQGGKATGGMKVKLEACRYALENGVPRAHIISGLVADGLLLEIFTNEGVGTLIT